MDHDMSHTIYENGPVACSVDVLIILTVNASQNFKRTVKMYSLLPNDVIDICCIKSKTNLDFPHKVKVF